MIKKFSEFIDIYTIKPTLYVNSRESISSKTGVFLSIITYLASVGIIFFLLKEYFDRKIYSITYSKELKKTYELNITEKPIYFGFYFQDRAIMENLDSLINISVTQVYKSFGGKDVFTYETSNLFVEKCNRTQLIIKNSNSLPKIFPDLNLWCLNSKNKNITIEGELNTNKDSSSIKIHFFKCTNSSQNENKCLDGKLIDDYLKKMYFIWGSQDFDIDHNSFQTPIKQKYFLEAQHFTIDMDSITEYFIKFKQVIYKSDSAMFMDEFETHTNSLHDKTEMQILHNYYPQEILRIILQTSDTREVYTRRYRKMQEAITQISAMVNLVNTILASLINLVGDNIYFEYLFNYSFSNDEAEIRINKIKFSELKTKFINGSNNTNNFNEFNDLRNEKEKVNTAKDKNLINKNNLRVNNDANNENNKTNQDKTNMNEIQEEISSFRNLMRNSSKINENKSSTGLRDEIKKIKIDNEYRRENNNRKISNFQVENSKPKEINEEKTEIKAKKEKRKYFELSFQDYVCPKFIKKRTESVQIFHNLIIIIKNILSVELLMTEIIDFS